MTAPWMPMPIEAWPCISAALQGEWPRWAAIMDLRWYDDQVRMGREKRIPGRPTLRKRWGGGAWTDWQIKQLLKDEAAWRDPRHQKPPANRQPTASAPPETATIPEVATERTASAPPADRQPTATRADLHTSHRHTNTSPPKAPPKGEQDLFGDEAQQSKPVDNSPKSAEKPEPTAKKSKRTKSLTVEEVCAIPLPIDLQSLEGYAEGFQRWCEVRKGTSWRRKPDQVERFHRKMAKAHAEGLDVLAGLEAAYDAGWQGLNPSYLKPRQQQANGPGPKQSIDDSAEAWQTVEAAMDAWGRRSPHGSHGWSFSDNPAEDARYCTAIRVATRRDDLRDAWVYLFENCRDPRRGPQLRSGFGYGWRTAARRSEVAA